MQEEFIAYIWENRLFNMSNLTTTEGESLEIINTGKRNSNSGPDFFNAQIKIGYTLWAGNIEIHQKASDWEKHNHTKDKAYDNVILHVVEKSDKKVFRNNGSVIPTLELSWSEEYNNNYNRLINSKNYIACQNEFHRIDPLFIKIGFHSLMIERLEEKTNEIIFKLKENNNNWNETFYQLLAQIFGFKINSIPFLLLAKAVPYKILSRHKNNLFQIESLLFGASGLLNEELTGDKYFLDLRNEFGFLYKKYKLKSVEAHLWKFMRLRPVNFPTIRISQLAGLIHNSQGLLSKITETEKLDKLRALFKVKATDYWDSHYRFNISSSEKKVKELGDLSVNSIIINVVIPFLFVYGETQNLSHLKDRSLTLLENIPPENNSIIRKWASLGVIPRSAFDTQALIQLKSRYCENRRCLYCPIGNKILKSTSSKSG